MGSRTFYYARVSTKDQHLERQLDAFRELGATDRDIITDKESGDNLDRAGYQSLKNFMLRPGDTLVIKSLDRLSRSKRDIRNELEWLKENDIRLKVIDLPTTMLELPEGQEWVFEMVNNILIEVLGTIAEHERSTMKARQAEGIAAARARGQLLGRPRVLKPEGWNDTIAQVKAGQITATAAIERLGLKRTTFYKLLKE